MGVVDINTITKHVLSTVLVALLAHGIISPALATSRVTITIEGTEDIISKSVSSNYIISGSGWGHGIGMSQNGARGMAQSGFSYADILTHYFSGTQIQ